MFTTLQISVMPHAGYMVNANATLGGGCPVPPPPAAFLQKLGDGFAACVEYASNVTALFGTKTESQVQSTADPVVRSPDCKKAIRASLPLWQVSKYCQQVFDRTECDQRGRFSCYNEVDVCLWMPIDAALIEHAARNSRSPQHP